MLAENSSEPRLRDLGIAPGSYPPGPKNAITDVPDILVGHTTLVWDTPRVARTGVTVILPRRGNIWREYAPAGIFSFNGCGELTGSHWIAESGMLTSPIALTNTGQVGTVYQTLSQYGQEKGFTDDFALPVVGETYDGWLNDIEALHITPDHVVAAIDKASDGPVDEGSVGGGTGMICHEFKGGIGTASRVVNTKAGTFILGALVQANYGNRRLLQVNGIPVGRILGTEVIPSPWARIEPKAGSIIVVIATNAPLMPIQCQRLAKRATVGLARVGGTGHNGSGDLFLAFSTGNAIPAETQELLTLQALHSNHISPLLDAAAEAVEEAILNALVAARTTTGYKGRTAYALPTDRLAALAELYKNIG